jgi:hypothetical protein
MELGSSISTAAPIIASKGTVSAEQFDMILAKR